MTKEFGIDSSLRDRTTVDSEIFLTLTWGVVVDHTRDNLLTHTAFTNDEHAQVGGRYL